MTTIQDFWFANRCFWFPVTVAEKAEADETIAKQFWNYYVSGENLVGQIIYYDQFSRHFQRNGLLTEEEVAEYREKAVILADEAHLDDEEDERVIVWSLMPYKHVGLLDQALERAAPHLREDWPLVRRFFEDTYKKYYTQERVAQGLVRDGLRSVSYLPRDICEEVGCLVLPRQFESNYAVPLAELVDAFVDIREKVVVSLSGGVDSMLLCYLYVLLGHNVTAVHIIYGNREESEQEYSFIADFCDDLGIPLVMYRIPWLRRATASREFYEKMTREIRFMVYRIVSEGAPVVLGHIYDDIVENIMTNFVRGDHLDWLGAMTTFDTQMGVRLVRPFLHVKKTEIYETARRVGLSWLKNTTPSWSNRGKFREKFHSALVEQYGAGVDDQLVIVAQRLQKQAEMLDRLLYEPMFKSYDADKKCISVKAGLNAKMDEAGWARVFEFICHEKMGIEKPTVGAIRQFIGRVERMNCEQIKIVMTKKLTVYVSGGWMVWP